MNQSNTNIQYDSSMITRIFIQLMPAAILSMIIPSINSVIDVFVASRYIGTDAVTSIGYYTPLTYVLAGIGASIAGGAVILMGKYLGNSLSKEVNELFTTDMIIIGIIMIIITAACELFSLPLSGILGACDDMIGNTGAYIRGVALSFPATYWSLQLTSFLELEQKHKRNIVGVVIMMLLNISLDIIFVAYLNMGLFGLGLATSIAAYGNFFIQIQYYFTANAQLRFSFGLFNPGMILSMIRIGFPGAATQGYLAIRGYMMNSMLHTYSGDVGIAALATQATLGAFTYAATYGISVATRTLFSIFVGTKDVHSIRTVMKTALYKMLPCSLIFAVIMTSLSGVFTRIFYTDPASEVYHLTFLLFLTNPFAMFLSGICQIFSTYYQCHSWMKITNIISLFDGIIGMAISMIILAPILGAFGIWLSYITNGIIVAIVILTYTIIRIRKFPHSIDDFLMLPDGFGIPDDCRMEFSVHTPDEVVKCSETIMDFCKSKNADERHCYYAGLAMEEMAANIIEHGFKNGKHHTCTIEIAATSEVLILKLIDDGSSFDPLKRLKLHNSDDPLKNIGLKLVRSISDDMTYSRVAGLNSLTLTLTKQ